MKGIRAPRFLTDVLMRWRSNGPRVPPRKSSPSTDTLCHVEIDPEPSEGDLRALRDALVAYNRSRAGDQHYKTLTIWLRDDHRQIVGGLAGSTYWGWLLIDLLWVDEAIRGCGYGRQLLVAAEREAQRRGCRYACLETFSFQAPEFYKKLGYVVSGTLDDFPNGYRRYSLKKQLVSDLLNPAGGAGLTSRRTVAEFVAHLSRLDIQVSVDGEQLRCNAPKGVLTEELRRELAARKKEILTWFQDNTGDPPLSFAQERLWFLDRLEPGTSTYTLAIRKRFRGSLDVTALSGAFTELVRRHEVLRTTFRSRRGHPAQHVADPESVPLPIVGLERYDPAERERVAVQVVQEETQRPFDLGRGPLIRPTLLRLSPDEHDLVVSIHHIIADGWSLGILARELNTLYEAFAVGRASPLPELPIQYGDFAAWQRRWMTDERFEAQRRYWREHLGGLPAPLRLPADQPRLSAPTSAGANHPFVVPGKLSDRLRELSHREGTTLFMTLLAAFKVLLARYSGEEDIVVGTPIANRNHVELEPVIGFFVNTLVLRTSLAGDPTFRELLSRVRQTCLDAYANPDMPFEKLVEDLRPARILGQNPLFEISFVFQGAAEDTGFVFVTVASPFDLTLFVRETNAGALSASIEYKRDFFKWETIARLAEHYRTLLEGIAADPGCPVSALPLLGESEAHRLLIEWNATATDYPCDRSVHGLFEDQVDATPDAIALVFDGVSLTYRELDQRANRLAHHLRVLGVGLERLVGVWMERSVDMIVALLGILKAGGAYVPFDLLAPPERLSVMLRDAQVDLLLTHERMRARFPAHELRTVCLDTDGGDIWVQPDTRPPGAVGSDGLAYVMFTSGSTGEPKGVAVTHRSVVRVVKNTDYARFGPDEVFLQMVPVSFDVSTFEIWGALLNGSRLAIAPPGVLSVKELGVVLARHGVTTLWLTAGLFHEVVDHGIGILGSLRQLLAGGDVLSQPHVRRALAALPACRLINGYGPTEGTTLTCCHTVTDGTSRGRSVPIGRPIANTRVYVLDRHLRPVPTGVPGELWIAGDGLARGYLNRPELTAERFIVRQFSESLEERLYRSGDLARWLGDGTLEFLGRLDDQVKIRGYRVEPGEIEVALVGHPRVREAAVVSRPAADGEMRLVAYVVNDGSLDPRDLREFLARKLPDYMVPAVFVALDRLPLTAAGKVDRKALPEPETRSRTIDSLAEPRDELERQLVKIWQDVFSLGPVGIQDNFFDLGGHSLLAVRMFAQLEEQLRVTLPLATLFQAPTIAGLAVLIRKNAQPASRRSLIPIQPAGSRPAIFGVPGVGGDVLGYHELARSMAPDQPFYGMQSRGLDGAEKPLTSIEDIAAAFLSEIRELQPEGPYFLVGACMGGVVAYELAQQLRTAGQQVGLLALLETWFPVTSSKRLRPDVRMLAARHIIVNRLRLHVHALAKLRDRQRFQYLFDRLKMLTQLVSRRDAFRGLRSEFYQQAVTQANLVALQQYLPRVYPGRVVLFCAENREVASDDDQRLAWTQLVTDLEIHNLPGADSGLMLTDPHVRVLARQLKACIESVDIQRRGS